REERPRDALRKGGQRGGSGSCGDGRSRSARSLRRGQPDPGDRTLEVTEGGFAMALLEVGDKAPEFRTTDQDGEAVSLKDFRWKKVALYSYPKHDTPGCTKEECGFRDDYSKFRKRKIDVLGVSVDDAKSHKKFAEKFDLPFRLLADTDKKIVKDYGVWGEKSL